MTERTRGFGVPDTIDPHHFVVTIPAGNAGAIIISEHFGVESLDGQPDIVVRCQLPREAWRAIANEAKQVLNDRLREKKLKPSRWSAGENLLERLLGKELCVLAWAVEAASPDAYPAAIAAWAGLKPEERWWLFRMAEQATGTADDTDLGWRKAIRIAFTETPGPGTSDTKTNKRKPKSKSNQDLVQMTLFEIEERNK